MATSSSSVTSSIAAGAGAGFDITAVIAQLMQMERQPIQVVQAKQAKVTNEINAVGTVRSKLSSLQTAAGSLAEPSSVDLWRATSTDEKIATIVAPAGSSEGSLSFLVDRVAGVHALRSRLVASSTSAAGGAMSADRLAVVSGLGKTGIRSVRAGSTLATGALAVAVEKATKAASISGSATAATTTVTNANNSFDVTVNGSTSTVSIASGVYDRAGLLSALQAAIAQSAGVSGKITAELDGSNAIVLQTVREGSAATLSVDGGTALGALGLSVSASPVNGEDGTLSVRGSAVSVSNTDAGNSMTVSVGGAGETASVTFSGGLRVGSATGAVVSTGSGSLADVVAAVNAAAVGVKAQSVQVGASQYRLQLTATASGEKAGIAVDPDSFDALGGMLTAVSNTDAKITLGEGAGAYSIESSTNTFSSVMGGWNVTVKSASATQVGVVVARDITGVSDKVKSLVTAANDAIAELKKQTVISVSGTKTVAGTLSGDSTFRSMLTSITTQFAGAGISGLAVGRDGTIKFDETAFKDAYTADPSGVAAKLGRGFSAQTGSLEYASASKETKSGTYAVNISSAATKGASSVAYAGGAAGADTIEVVRGSTTVTYSVSAGESAASIALGLQSALDAKGVALTAETSSGGVRLAASSWGSGGAFKVKFTASGAQENVTGTDVAGTIDGKTATGFGQYLSLGTDSTSGAAGLRIDTSKATTGAGSVTYKTGLAGAVAYAMTGLLRSGNGTLSLAESSRQTRVRAFTTQMDAMERRATAKEAQLKKQYAALDSTLGKMKGQLSSLASQLGNLSNSNGN